MSDQAMEELSFKLHALQMEQRKLLKEQKRSEKKSNCSLLPADRRIALVVLELTSGDASVIADFCETQITAYSSLPDAEKEIVQKSLHSDWHGMDSDCTLSLLEPTCGKGKYALRKAKAFLSMRDFTKWIGEHNQNRGIAPRGPLVWNQYEIIENSIEHLVTARIQLHKGGAQPQPVKKKRKPKTGKRLLSRWAKKNKWIRGKFMPGPGCSVHDIRKKVARNGVCTFACTGTAEIQKKDRFRAPKRSPPGGSKNEPPHYIVTRNAATNQPENQSPFERQCATLFPDKHSGESRLALEQLLGHSCTARTQSRACEYGPDVCEKMGAE